NDGFHAELGMAAAARVETEIEPALARTAVRELDERRRLETAAEVAINAGARGDPENQPGHRGCPAVGLRAAVVCVAWQEDEVVGRSEFHVAGTQSGVRRPPFSELPFTLHEQTGCRDFVVFVAFQCALDTVLVSKAS